MPRFETKFKIGQKIYSLRKELQPLKNTCPVCNGTCKIEIHMKMYRCPECEGNGIINTMTDKKFYLFNENCPISRIMIDINNENEKVLYFMVGDWSGTEEEDIFATEEEAIAEMKRRNKLIRELRGDQ